jgi:phosphatidylglycerophosphate synthase
MRRPDDNPPGARIVALAPLQQVALAAAGGSVIVGAASLALTRAPMPALTAAVFFGAVTLVALGFFAQLRPRPPFGAANAITLCRAALIAVVAGFAVDPPPAEDSDWWIAALLAGTALLLDGADGWTARRRGLATAFGARFDMETDALAALVLSLALWQAERTGAWIVAVGALRYLFLVAGWAFATMRRPLPPSRRRRAVAALQATLLTTCLVPALPGWAAPALGAAALAATSLSFLIDTIWLMRRRRRDIPA